MTRKSAPNWNEYTAVFGGTFDPPHVGHRIAAFHLFKDPGFSRVKIIPSAIPPLKTTPTETEHRLEMVKKTFAPSPHDPQEVEIDLREIERSKSGKPSYTFDTLSELKTTGLKFAFVLGTDQLESLPRWYRFPELLSICPWIVLERKPDATARIEKMLTLLESSGIVKRVGDRRFELPGSQFLYQIPTPAPELNSTEIRREIALKGDLAPGLITPEVTNYIREKRLYGGLRS